MIIVGAKGLAKEVLQILDENDEVFNLVFFDDINLDSPQNLYNSYQILRTKKEVRKHFELDNRFTLGLGNPKLRKMLCQRFEEIGGQFTSIINRSLTIGKHVSIGEGCIIMAGAKLSNNVKLGKGVLVYYNCIITHDVEIGDFVELSPGCILLGNVIVEDDVHIGAGAIILPKLKVGKGATVGAGAVVTKDVAPYSIVLGNPAKKIYQ